MVVALIREAGARPPSEATNIALIHAKLACLVRDP